MFPTGSFRGFDIRLEPPGIAVITFNQPERLNGLAQPIKRDLIEAITQAQMDDRVRVLLFTGSGRAFCAGDDITGRPLPGGPALVPDIFPGHREEIGTYKGLRVLSQSLNTAIRNLDKLTIAAINGVAIQSGLSLALACDFRIASTDARLGSATLRFGLLPDEGGHALLVQGVIVGWVFLGRYRLHRALRVLLLLWLTFNPIFSNLLLIVGLVDSIFPLRERLGRRAAPAEVKP